MLYLTRRFSEMFFFLFHQLRRRIAIIWADRRRLSSVWVHWGVSTVTLLAASLRLRQQFLEISRINLTRLLTISNFKSQVQKLQNIPQVSSSSQCFKSYQHLTSVTGCEIGMFQLYCCKAEESQISYLKVNYSIEIQCQLNYLFCS